ncbi:hypothetical protein ACLOJK_035491 [Asimina triloba]
MQRIISRRLSTTTTALKEEKKRWDAIVVGGGHNGLTAAAYLARSGLSVAVFEKRRLLGGAAVTEEIVPGFRFSRCSYLQSLLRPSVIRDLDLKRHGLKLLKRNPSSFTPCLDGRYLLLGPDAALNHSQISKFSAKDAEAYPRYENQLQKFCTFMDSILDSPTPEIRRDIQSFTGDVRDKADVLKATLATDAVIGTMYCARNPICQIALKSAIKRSKLKPLPHKSSTQLAERFATAQPNEALLHYLMLKFVVQTSAHAPGSGYVLLHHVMGETDGDRGIWSYVEGGMGSVSLAIANAARESGAHIMTGAEVALLRRFIKTHAKDWQVTLVKLVKTQMGDIKKQYWTFDPLRPFIEVNRKKFAIKVGDTNELKIASVVNLMVDEECGAVNGELLPQDVLPEDFLCAIKNLDYSSVDLFKVKALKNEDLLSKCGEEASLRVGGDCLLAVVAIPFSILAVPCNANDILKKLSDLTIGRASSLFAFPFASRDGEVDGPLLRPSSLLLSISIEYS